MSSTSSALTPHWRGSIQKALHRHRSDPEARYLQMATVDPRGRPRNRTVVFRGFWQETNQVQLAVDQRSEKIAHLQQCPFAELCWYFSKTREQFRLTGSVVVVQDPHHGPATPELHQARQQLWTQLSTKSRLLWYWPEPKALQSPITDYDISVPETSAPPPTFVYLLLDPDEVDHLQLKGDLKYPQVRYLYRRQGGNWLREAVNP